MTDDVEKLLEQGIDAQDKNGKTALILATWRSDLPTIQHLLQLGADVSIVDNLGENVVHYAARQNDPKVLLTILETSADKNLKSKSCYNQTPIFTPAQVGKVALLRTLLENGTNPNVYDKGKFTPLQWAAQQGQVDCVKLLLEHGADPNTKSSKGITPLMSASIKGLYESVALLVNAGAEINATAKDGYTPLIYASYYGHVEIVEYLLNKGADRDLMSTKEETALTIATKKKFYAVISLLSN